MYNYTKYTNLTNLTGISDYKINFNIKFDSQIR